MSTVRGSRYCPQMLHLLHSFLWDQHRSEQSPGWKDWQGACQGTPSHPGVLVVVGLTGLQCKDHCYWPGLAHPITWEGRLVVSPLSSLQLLKRMMGYPMTAAQGLRTAGWRAGAAPVPEWQWQKVLFVGLQSWWLGQRKRWLRDPGVTKDTRPGCHGLEPYPPTQLHTLVTCGPSEKPIGQEFRDSPH
jgi:hypothetical protein